MHRFLLLLATAIQLLHFVSAGKGFHLFDRKIQWKYKEETECPKKVGNCELTNFYDEQELFLVPSQGYNCDTIRDRVSLPKSASASSCHVTVLIRNASSSELWRRNPVVK
jgi:hypothetical protein